METKKAQRKCWTLHDTASGIKVLSTARLRRLDIPGLSTLFLKTFAFFGQNPAWCQIFCFENP
jgi:hypothetical protein